MWNKYLPMLYILLCMSFTISKVEAQSQASASASAVAVAVSQVPEPLQPNPVIEALAQSILEGLLNSAVLGSAAYFVIDKPYDVFYELSSSILEKAGINDTSLAEGVAEAVGGVGPLTSQVYFGVVGYSMATLLFNKGIATIANVNALSLSIVNAVSVNACVGGITDAVSVVQAVVYGLYDIFKSYGLLDYETAAYSLSIFRAEIKILSGVY